MTLLLPEQKMFDTNRNYGETSTLTQIESDQKKLEDIKDKELPLNKYHFDTQPSVETTQEIGNWVGRQTGKEQTRTKLAMGLVKVFGGSLVGTFILMSVAAFIPSADKPFIKDIVPLLITPQATLLGTALGYYFAAKDEED
jgi:hypothetical protein